MEQLEFMIEKSDAKPFITPTIKERTKMWQKKGKGPKYKGSYFYDKGERYMILVGPPLKGKNKPHVVSVESWQMAKQVGWVKVG